MAKKSTPRSLSWRRSVVAALAGSACLAGGMPVATGSAAAVAADTCPDAFPVADLTAGMLASGLTVEKGNVADSFDAEVVGVIGSGIGPGVDMIIMELDSPALDRAGGVWSGMSGSPVYAADGRLIGAVSYGLSGGPSKIAGITPAADMFALLGRSDAARLRPAERVALPSSVRSRLAASGKVTAAQTSTGLRQLPVPLGVSGISSVRLGKASERLQKQLPNSRIYAAGAAAVGGSASPADIFPGSNFAAAISYGDITAAGTGTTTAVCGDAALAFGHPLTFTGAASFSVHPATAVYVQPDSLGAPFKVANPGGTVGTLDQDRLAGIRGRFGAAPAAVPVTSYLTATGNVTRSGRTDVNGQDFVAGIGAEHLLANMDRVADRLGGGTAQLRVVVDGKRASGASFQLDTTNRYADVGDVSFAAFFPVLEQLWAVADNPFEDTEITAVRFTGSMTDRFTDYSVGAVAVRRPNGAFVRLSAAAPLEVTAGTRLHLRVTLVPYRNIGPARNVDLSVAVPANTAGGMASLAVTGGPGNMFEDEPQDTTETFDDVLRDLRTQTPNNSVNATLVVEKETATDVVQRRTQGRALTDQVVVGARNFPIDVAAPGAARVGVVNGASWSLRNTLSAGKATTTLRFGRAADAVVTGDWDGNGTVTPAVFRNGTWIVQRTWSAASRVTFRFGATGDIPVVGDWDGDGRDSIGVHRRGRWLLRNALSAGGAHADFVYGGSDSLPVAGDWDGDGVDTPGLFRNGVWSVRNANSSGPSARSFRFGRAGDVPVVGDWNRNGRDDPGVYRRGQWGLRNALSAGPAARSFRFGTATSRPVVWG